MSELRRRRKKYARRASRWNALPTFRLIRGLEILRLGRETLSGRRICAACFVSASAINERLTGYETCKWPSTGRAIKGEINGSGKRKTISRAEEARSPGAASASAANQR